MGKAARIRRKRKQLNREVDNLNSETIVRYSPPKIKSSKKHTGPGTAKPYTKEARPGAFLLSTSEWYEKYPTGSRKGGMPEDKKVDDKSDVAVKPKEVDSVSINQIVQEEVEKHNIVVE